MMKKVLSASIAAAMVVASSASVFAATDIYEKGEFGNSSKTYYYNSYRETDGLGDSSNNLATAQDLRSTINGLYNTYTVQYTAIPSTVDASNLATAQANAKIAFATAKDLVEKLNKLYGYAASGTPNYNGAVQTFINAVNVYTTDGAYSVINGVTDATKWADEFGRLKINAEISNLTTELDRMVANSANNGGAANNADKYRAEYAYNRDVLKEAIRQAEKLADWNTGYGYAAEYSTSAKAAFEDEIARAKNVLAVKGTDETTKGVGDVTNREDDTVKPSDTRATETSYKDKIADMQNEIHAIVSEAIRLIKSRFTDARLEAEKTSNTNTANWRSLNQVIIDQQKKVDEITRDDVSKEYASDYYLYRNGQVSKTYSLVYDRAIKEAVYVVDAAVRAVQNATGKVVVMSDLKTEIDRAEKLNKMDFTNDYFALYDEMTKVLADSKAVYNKNNATQTEVDSATSKLKAALDKLVVNDDIQVRLKSVLTKIAKLNPHDFSAQSWAALQNAVNAAKVFYKGSLTDAYANDTDAALALLALEQALDALVPATSDSAADSSSAATTPTTPAPKVPKTGDETPFAATAMLLVIAAAGATVIVRKNSLTK